MRLGGALVPVLLLASRPPSTAFSATTMSAQRLSEFYPTVFKELPSMEGKTVAITGASRGLGYVTALALAKKGDDAL